MKSLSVRSFQVPATPSTRAWPPSLPPTHLRGHTRHSDAKEFSWSTIVLMVFFSSRISPFTSTVDLLGEVAVGNGGGSLGDVYAPDWSGCWPGVHAIGDSSSAGYSF